MTSRAAQVQVRACAASPRSPPRSRCCCTCSSGVRRTPERPPLRRRSSSSTGTDGQSSRKALVPGGKEWSRQPDLNRRPTVYETVALPTELCRPGGRALLLTARDFWGQAEDRVPTVSPAQAVPHRARPGDRAAGLRRTWPATASPAACRSRSPAWARDGSSDYGAARATLLRPRGERESAGCSLFARDMMSVCGAPPTLRAKKSAGSPIHRISIPTGLSRPSP